MCLLCLAPVYAQVAASHPPQRIVSLNMCLDQLLWRLVAPERLVSLSYLSANPAWSPIAEQVQDMRLNHGLAEEIVPLNPDLIVAGEFEALEAVALLARLGHPTTRVPVPRTLADISGQVRQLGELVGESDGAEQMVQQLNTQLAALARQGASHVPLSALWYSSNGIVIGKGTLEHELMTLAGLRNLAAERDIWGFQQLDLELLLSLRPDLLIVEESQAEAFSLAREYLSHPALKTAGFTLVRLPAGLSGCAAAVVGDVAQSLAQALNEQGSHPASGSGK